uniref:Uncharacterized protein n=1 Tax=Lactuca sativa TaxID=4236 RepID=A0A9R1VJR8_LACSA|nr:hypothetical protein LSAT_V11C500283190 [Lactuca sativa]
MERILMRYPHLVHKENFELPHEDKVLMEYVDEQMWRQWKRTRSITNHKFAMTDKKTRLPSSPIKLYHKLHFHPIKKWINDESHIQYL